VVVSTDEKESIVYGEVDLDSVAEVRRNIPISTQKRLEVYTPAHPFQDH
jgi:predicted amidohydrolase